MSPTRTPEYWARLAAEEQAVLVRWGADRARALAHLGVLTSWQERLVLAAWHWTRDVTQYRSLSQMDAPLGSKERKPDTFRNRSCEPVWDLGMFSAAFPQFWATEAEVNLNGAPWDSVALGRWFAARAVAQKVPTPKAKYPTSHGLFGPKYKPVWRFESTDWGTGPYGTGLTRSSVSLTRKGELLPPGGKIGFSGLQGMAGILDLTDPALDIAQPMTSDGQPVSIATWYDPSAP